MVLLIPKTTNFCEGIRVSLACIPSLYHFFYLEKNWLRKNTRYTPYPRLLDFFFLKTKGYPFAGTKQAVSIPSFRMLQSGKFSLLLRAAKGIPKFPQVFLQRDKGHEAVSVPSLYPFLRVKKKTLFEGTLSIPSPEKIRLRDIPKFPQVSLRRESSYLVLCVRQKTLFEGTRDFFAKDIPKLEQVKIRKDKGHEAVSVFSLYPFLRVRKKTLFEGTRRIPSPEKIRLRNIPKLEEVSLRRDKGHEAVSVPSLYPFLRVRKKTLFEGTRRIPSPENYLIRDIPKFPQVSLRRESSYFFFRVKEGTRYFFARDIPKLEQVFFRRNTYFFAVRDTIFSKRVSVSSKRVFFFTRSNKGCLLRTSS